MLKYIYYLHHFLFCKRYTNVDSNFLPLKNENLSVLNFDNAKEVHWTIIVYPTKDIYSSYITSKETPITLLIDYKPGIDILYLIDMYAKEFNLVNVIILNENNDKEIYLMEQVFEDNKTKHNILEVNKEITYSIKKAYSPELIYICQIKILKKIPNALIILFHLVLVLFLITLYITLRTYISVRTKKDPVITDLELDSCPIMFYADISEKMFEQCLVCMDDYKLIDKVRVLHCEHYFHSDCVDPWLKKKCARCPYCRRLIKIDI